MSKKLTEKEVKEKFQELKRTLDSLGVPSIIKYDGGDDPDFSLFSEDIRLIISYRATPHPMDDPIYNDVQIGWDSETKEIQVWQA